MDGALFDQQHYKELRQQLEQAVAERERVEKALKESESRYRSLFEDSPVSMWEEDWSRVKQYFDKLPAAGITDFRTYFYDHPEAVLHCLKLVRLLDVNQATLDLHQAKTKDELLAELGQVLPEESHAVFCEELIALAEGHPHFESEAVHQTLTGQKKHILLRLHVPSSYKDSLARVFVCMLDITERKQAQAALQKAHDELDLRVKERTAELARANAELRAEITERKRAEATLQQRNRELAMLNRLSQVFISTLDLDQVLTTVLDEVCRLLNAIASAVWLIDPASNELVCRQVINPQDQAVRGWRLPLGQGVAGWVAQHGQSLVVPDTRLEKRHFKRVDQQIGLEMRSILSVPLRVKQRVIGVIQVVDTTVNRFSSTDLTLIEPLAATAAIAIENARLYEQARQDAQTKLILFNEVNHRVKNNLAAIIGLLYAERDHTGVKEEEVYQAIMKDLINRIQSLSTVHRLLSDSEWSPPLLSELASQVIYSALQMLSPDKNVSVNVLPSPIRVTPDQAHNLALIINELATNTVKYALSGRSTVSITVHITLAGDTAGEAFSIANGDPILFEFRDDGPGYPQDVLQSDRRGDNVGFDLIQSIVRDGLNGQLLLHNDQGAVTTIQFKAEVPLDPAFYQDRGRGDKALGNLTSRGDSTGT